jgi:hypothetical protein
MITQALAELPMIIVDIMTTDETKKFSVYERMANAIADLTRKNGGCLPQDLLALGFTKDKTIDHWQMAQTMASVELKLMDGGGLPNFKREKRHG